jgi:hypothetical protein
MPTKMPDATALKRITKLDLDFLATLGVSFLGLVLVTLLAFAG